MHRYRTCAFDPQLEILDPSKLYLHWSVLLNTEKSEEDLENVLMFFLEEEE